LTAEDLNGLVTTTAATAYVCGPTSFVENAADLLLDAGFAASRIRTERFGPTGG
jgi:ferredoxin-NADP reductase